MGSKNLTTSNSIHFLNVVHQTKTLHNFHEGHGVPCQEKDKEMLKKGKILENLEENVLNLKIC